MRVAVFGILPFSDLIKEGFKKLGHKISNENPDIIYSNDPVGYQDAIFLKDRYPKAYLIFNFLDNLQLFSLENLFAFHILFRKFL